MHLLTNSKYMKEKLTELKKETDKSIIIVGDFMTPIWLLLEQLNKKSYIKNLQYYQIIWYLEKNLPSNWRIHSPWSAQGWTIHQDTHMLGPREDSINLKGLKSYRLCSLNTMKLN